MAQMQPLAKSIFQNARRTALTNDEMFRLWRAAIKDDANFIDTVIEKIYKEMMSFDSERAENIIELMVRRNSAAGYLFRDLLEDMQDLSGLNLGESRASWPAHSGF